MQLVPIDSLVANKLDPTLAREGEVDMMLPTDIVALANARREAIEKEIHTMQLLAALPPQTPFWRMWAGNGMVWTGSKLVQWGEGVARKELAPQLEIWSKAPW
jgi:hypothetical protein